MQINWIVAGLVLLCATGLQADDSVSIKHEIPAVQTLDELRNVPVFACGDYGSVRIGIESNQCPQRGGVLVYALVQRNEKTKASTRYDHDGALGPLGFEYESEVGAFQNHALRAEQVRLIEGVDPVANSNELLYLRVAMVRQQVRRIKIKSPDGKTASVSINSTATSFEPWSTLRLRNPTRVDRAKGLSYELQVVVRNMVQALPAYDGGLPFHVNQKKAGDQPLPKIYPSEPSETFKLSGNASEIRLRSDSSIELSSIDDRLLARWWVNGEFISTSLDDSQTLLERTGQVVDGRELRIVLDSKSLLGIANPGDKIGLQLLHVPSGWLGFGKKNPSAHLCLRINPRMPVSRMTDRIEFTIE